MITHLFGAVGDIAEVVARARRRPARRCSRTAPRRSARASGGRHGGRLRRRGGIQLLSDQEPRRARRRRRGLDHDAAARRAVRRLRQYGWDEQVPVRGRAGATPGSTSCRRRSCACACRCVDARQRPPARDHRALRGAAPARVRVLPARAVYVGAPGRGGRRASARTCAPRLADRGDQTDVHYPVPDHRAGAVRRRHADVRLPVTERACEPVLSLPLLPRAARTTRSTHGLRGAP